MNSQEAPIEARVGERGGASTGAPAAVTHVVVGLALVSFLVGLALLAWGASLG